MGAVALVPAHQFDNIKKFLQQEIDEQDLCNESLRELCEGYFFFPAEVDEEKAVAELLERESKAAGYDLILLPHENCNFRCTYCYETHERGKMKPEIVEGLKTFVKNKCGEINGLTVAWFGGEPLLAKDIIYELSDSFLHSCEQNHIPYTSSITTNGYLLSTDVVACLLKHKIKHFQVTIDGPETTHDNTRKLANGGQTYKTILNNLIEMRNIEADFRVSIRVNFNDDSISVMEQFFNEVSELFGNDSRFVIFFRPIGKWGGPNDRDLQVCAPQQAKLLEIKLMEKFMPSGFLDRLDKIKLSSHGFVCYAAKESSIIVGSDGTIYKCTIVFDDPRNQVGRLTGDGRLVIDQSRWDLWVKNDGKDTGGCGTCPLNPACQGKSCPRDAIYNKRVSCPFSIEEYENMIRLIASGSRSGRFQ